MKIAALLLYAFVGLGFTSLGVVYLATDEFMAYHADAVGSSWAQLDAGLQGLLLGLIRGLGAGAFSCGVALIALSCLSWQKGVHHYRGVLALIAIGFSSFLAYAMFTVYSMTPAEPPIWGGVMWLVASLTAAGCLLVSGPDRNDK